MAFLQTTSGSYLPPATITTILREDLIEVAYIIDPYETSMFTMLDRVDVDSPVVQWITDTLPTLVGTNTAGSIDVAGINYLGLSEDFTPGFTNYPYSAQPRRQTSYIQIFGGLVGTTDILANARVSGIKNPYSHEQVKALKVIAKAFERRAVDSAEASTVAGWNGGQATDPRSFRPMFEYRSGGTGAAAPFLGEVTANSTLKVSHVDTGMETAVRAGGMPEYLFVGVGSKLDFSIDARQTQSSALSTINQSFINAQERRIIRQVDFYHGEYGTLAVVMNRQIPESSSTTGGGKAWLLQRNMHAWGTYMPVEHTPLAKTGPQTRGMLLGAGLWIVRNAAANVVINGVTT
jgi:hypothetical protein